MKYLHTNDVAQCMHSSSTDLGFRFGIWFGMTRQNDLHAGLQFERNGLDRRHFGLDA